MRPAPGLYETPRDSLRDTPSLAPWLSLANSTFDAWIGFWTRTASGQPATLLDMQRQVLQAWTSPWLAFGIPQRGVADAPRTQASRAAPPAPAPSPATRVAAPPIEAPRPEPAAAPVAMLGAPAPIEAAPAEAAPVAAAPVEAVHVEAVQAEPMPKHRTAPHAIPTAEARPDATPARKPAKSASPLRATPPRKSAGRMPVARKQIERKPKAAATRARKATRKPAH